jgi:hypothetical protein
MDERAKVTFGIIALNAMPLLRYNLKSLYPYAYEIIVVEGACLAARKTATADGHSTDETLEMLRQFKRDSDPQDKFRIVTAEDVGATDGFWPEKDEMSQAYAAIARGDWLWQVDADEFYLERDVETVLDMLSADPHLSGASFPYLQFWGSLHSVEDGEWTRHGLPYVDRLFRWGPGYRYTQHRPPIVLDERGHELKRLQWVNGRIMRRAGVRMYHYSTVFPQQVRRKADYYSNVSWTDAFKNMGEWYQDTFCDLKHPFHVSEDSRRFVQWLRPFTGPHPKQIEMLQDDITSGRVMLPLRETDDIDRLLGSILYKAATRVLAAAVAARWGARQMRRNASSLLKRLRGGRSR